MKLRTPITGTTIEVHDDRAAFFVERGFVAFEPKKPARKRRTTSTTKKEA